MKKVLVTGATGSLGSAISAEFVNNGYEVIAGVRTASKFSETKGVTPIAFDYEKPETYEPALKDVNTVVLIAPPLDPLAFEKMEQFIELVLAKKLQVGVVSALGMNHMPEAGLAKIENFVKSKSDVYTVVRPNFFTENLTTGFLAPMIQHAGAIFLAAGTGKTAFISVKDIAAVLVKSLVVPDLNKSEFDIQGSEALTHDEVIAIYNEIKGTSIKYVPISSEDAKKGAVDSGMSEGSADMLVGMYDAVAAGYWGSADDSVEKITGKKALTLREVLA